MDRASGGDFDEDEEVRLYMRDRIKDDACLCKKYGKTVNGKICPLCFDSRSLGETKKKQSKKGRIPTGNYGRTGSLAKPDLLTIPENDISNHITDALFIKTNITDATCVKQLNNNQIGCKKQTSDYNRGEMSEILVNLGPLTNDTSLSNKEDFMSHGTLKRQTCLRKRSVVIHGDLLSSEDAEGSGIIAQESRDQDETLKARDNETMNSETTEICYIRKQKPILIPAQEFIGRYLTTSKKPRHPAGNETQGLGTSGSKTHSYGIRGSVDNATDDQVIIEGFSNISVNDNYCSDQNFSGYEKRRFH